MMMASGARNSHSRRRRVTGGRLRRRGAARIMLDGDSPDIVFYGLSKRAPLCRRSRPVRRAKCRVRERRGPMHTTAEHESGDLWVFGYGSLMWRPGFAYVERVSARLIGLHGALCVYSFVHRGTPERPGLVLGLDRGGMCRGIAGRVTAAARAATIAYLRAREQVTTVYLETVRRIELEEKARRQVRALCFIVDRSHVQYAGRLTLDQCLHLVRQGHGSSGANRDYVIETARALETLGYWETDLHLITERLGGAGLAKRVIPEDSAPLDT